MPSRNREHPLRKLPVDPRRIRSMPRQFGAIDRNLVYRSQLPRMSLPEIALYTFLICVSDPQGLSYYSDRRLSHDLHLTTDELLRARAALVTRQFILYRTPIYQLLDLPPASVGPTAGPTPPASPAPVGAPARAVRGMSDRQPARDSAGGRAGKQEAVPIGTVIRSLLGDHA